MLLCASELRFAWGRGAEALVRLVADGGFDGIAVGAACAQRDLPSLVALGASSGVGIRVLSAPLGEGPPVEGRRLPFLAAVEDANERLAAVKLVESTWSAAAPFGVSAFTLNLGGVALHHAPASLARDFARRELDDDDDEPGARRWSALLAERRALSQGILDACRDALDRLLPAAEATGLRLAVEVTGPWGAPTPREAELLLDEYRGAPLFVVWDEARLQALGALGIAPHAARRMRLAEATQLLRCSEAVGIETGFAPGLGDPDGEGAWPSATPTQPTRVPPFIVVAGRPDSRVDEIDRARSLVEARMAPVEANVASDPTSGPPSAR